jgi:hypothetical protein
MQAEMSKMLKHAFRTAFLLTGSSEAAETAVLDAIASLDPDRISSDPLLSGTINSAVRRRAIQLDHLVEMDSAYPVELRRVLLLAAEPRQCFVLRVLLDLAVETCSDILGLSTREVENGLRTAMLALPYLEGGGTPRTTMLHSSSGVIHDC